MARRSPGCPRSSSSTGGTTTGSGHPRAVVRRTITQVTNELRLANAAGMLALARRPLPVPDDQPGDFVVRQLSVDAHLAQPARGLRGLRRGHLSLTDRARLVAGGRASFDHLEGAGTTCSRSLSAGTTTTSTGRRYRARLASAHALPTCSPLPAGLGTNPFPILPARSNPAAREAGRLVGSALKRPLLPDSRLRANLGR